MSRFCNSCGSPLDPESQFCAQCGAVIEGDELQSAPPSKLDISNTSGFKLGVFVSSAILILSAFLPYISVSIFGLTQSVSLIDGEDGFIFIAVAIAVIVAAALNKPRLTVAFSVLSVCLCFFEMANTSSQLGEYAALVNKGMGYYLSLISAIALAVFSVLFLIAARKRK